MRHYRLGVHSKSDLKVHMVWVPKYQKRVLIGQVTIRARDIIRQIAMVQEISILSGKVAYDHVHLFIKYRPNQPASKLVPYLEEINSQVLLQEFAHLRKQFWERHFWARGYLAVSFGNITDEMIQRYIDSQEGEPVHDDSRFH